MKTKATEIKPGDVIEYRGSGGLLVMEVDEVSIGKDAGNNGPNVWLRGHINSNETRTREILFTGVGHEKCDIVKLPLTSEVNVTFNFLNS